MQGNRSRDTSPELALRAALHARGLRYRIHYRPVPGVRCTADIAFTRARLAVFVDGCFWHACPEHFVPSKSNVEYWTEKIERNRSRDRANDTLLSQQGWRVLRVYEHVAVDHAVRDVMAELQRVTP
jgi:DNA mismatch endonuclease (patch repair protein)